jgi:hypothetical protein
MPLRKNKMVETAYPLRKEATEYARIILVFRNRTIDHPVYGQDIAEEKLERLLLPTRIHDTAKSFRTEKN